MINNQIAYYLGSKILAAILNLVTMAIFVRLGGKETYGAYLIQLAWAYMLYSITIQWLRFSFFACFRENIQADLIATYLRIALAGFAGLVVTTLICVVTGFMTAEFAVAIILLIFGLASYEAFTEIARTQLQARTVAIGVMIRAVLMLVFGVLALSFHSSAFFLALSVGMAHFGAALVLFWQIKKTGAKNTGEGRWSNEAATKLWDYGRPLIPAFGLDALGLQLDRLLLAHFTTLETVGLYGATADFIRQTMIVVAEAISGAYFTVARKRAEEGKLEETRQILGEAFLAYTALTLFVSAFVLRFDRLIFDTLFGAEMGAAIEPVIAFVMLSTIVTLYRAYYFGQAVYLTNTSRELLYSDGMQVLVTTLSGLLLVPFYGITGAAMAMFCGQLAGIMVYLVLWRSHYILKLPYRKALLVLALATGLYWVSGRVETAFADQMVLAVILNLVLFATVTIGTAYRFNILSLGDLLTRLFMILQQRGTVRKPQPGNAKYSGTPASPQNAPKERH